MTDSGTIPQPVPNGSSCLACAVELPVLADLFLVDFGDGRAICRDEIACARRSVALFEAGARLGLGRKTHDETRKTPEELRAAILEIPEERRLKAGLLVCEGCGQAAQAQRRYCSLCGAEPSSEPFREGWDPSS